MAANPEVLIQRKHLRPHLRRDLVIQPQTYGGRTSYLVKDPIRLAYFRFQEPEYFLMRLLDGRHTLEAVRSAFEQRFRPRRLSMDEVEGFLHQLLQSELLQRDSAQAGQQLWTRAQEERSRQRWSRMANLLCYQLPLCDPDRLLTRMVPPLRWLFSGWAFAASIGLFLLALLLVAARFDVFRERLPTLAEFFSLEAGLLLALVMTGVKVLHELGHGLCCKTYGGEVHEMGVMFMGLAPCLYCDVTDSWTLPSKWQRMAVGFAGIYVELLLASCAAFVWWQMPAHPWISQLCLYLILACSVNTLLFNSNPLLRLDGYFILADWLEIPNLRERSSQFLHRLVCRALGLGGSPQPALSPRRALFFTGYAAASFIYRMLLAAGILWFLLAFFKRHGLEAVGCAVFALALASLLLGPMYRLIRGWKQRGRHTEMDRRRLLFNGGLFIALALAILLLPLPINHIHQAALVQAHPDGSERIFLTLPGVLERIHVRNGQRVAPGDLLAEFRNLDLESSLDETRTRLDMSAVRRLALQEQQATLNDPVELGQIARELAAATTEQQALAQQLRVYEKLRKQLEVRAPRAGIVVGLPTADALGKLHDGHRDQPFARVVDPTRLQAVVPLTPADHRTLRQELGTAPAIQIRVAGQGGHCCRGQVAALPEAAAREIPAALSSQAGGPIAVQPGTCAPRDPPYLVTMDFLEPDASIYPGALAQVKIACRWRTCGWWLWRTWSAVREGRWS